MLLLRLAQIRQLRQRRGASIWIVLMSLLVDKSQRPFAGKLKLPETDLLNLVVSAAKPSYYRLHDL